MPPLGADEPHLQVALLTLPRNPVRGSRDSYTGISQNPDATAMPEQLEERVTEYVRLGNSGLKVSKVRSNSSLSAEPARPAALQLIGTYCSPSSHPPGHPRLVRRRPIRSSRKRFAGAHPERLTLVSPTCSMSYGNKQWAEWVLEKDEALEHFKAAYEVRFDRDRTSDSPILRHRASKPRA